MARLSTTFGRRLAALEAVRRSALPQLSGAELDAAVSAYEAMLASTETAPVDPEWSRLTSTEAAERYFDLIRRS
jgi:hypothetical protein